MINAPHLVSSISFKRLNADGKLFRQRFPGKFCFREINNVFGCKDLNRVKGTYVAWELVPIIVTWANTMQGYFLVNGIRHDVERDTTGYIYIVQLQEHEGTNKYKIGRTWNHEMRFTHSGKDLKVIKCEKVGDMYRAENSLIYNMNSLVEKPFKGKLR